MLRIAQSQNYIIIIISEPRPPQTLVVEATSTSDLLISWSMPDQGGVDNYTVTLTPSHADSPPFVLVVSDLSINFTEGTPGETYNVTVASNKGGEFSSSLIAQQSTCKFLFKS